MWSSPATTVRLYTPLETINATKIAAFDMDSTLITSKDRTQIFPKSRTDWAWWHPTVPQTLRNLNQQGYHIVIFTNQSGVSSGTRDIDSLTGKITDIIQELHIPVTALMALEHDQYRKPATGLYNLFLSTLTPTPLTDVFYCGDAAGRIKAWDGNKKTKKDFSCSDRKFAANIGAKFMTPEEFFLSQAPTDKWIWGSIDPQEILAQSVAPAPFITPKSDTQELIIMIGCPASGKSKYSKAAFPQYIRASNDEVGNKKKALSIAKDALQKNLSVVVDNTNPCEVDRKEWIMLAKKCGVKTIRCIYMNTPRDVAEHMNIYRETTTGKKRVPSIVYNIFFSKFSNPTVEEGFTEIHVIPFSVFFEASDESSRKAFIQWS